MTPEENDLMSRVEGDAPMGQIMRRHWIPACLSEEVAEPDGAPVAARLLGENLVIFRDTQGRLGILDERCPHRQASLVFGRNEECGLRCLYHGWKMDVNGDVLEMCSEPPGTRFPEKVKQKAYPAREAGGFVWTYMGPPQSMPDFQPPAFAPTAETRVSVAKIHVACNWAQVLEGAIDSAHSSTLHASDMVPAQVDRAAVTNSQWLRPSTDKAPILQVQITDFGFRYAAIRHPIHNAETHDYVRITLFVAPYTVLIPPNSAYNVAALHIPMDDANTAFYFMAWGGDGVPDQETWRKFCAAQVGIDVDSRFRKVRSRENHYLQDRQAMKLGNFTGIQGIPNQDIAMWETMGQITDRTRDRLGKSDIAIIEFRKLMVRAAQEFSEGKPAIGTSEPRLPQAKLRSYEGVVPKSTDWRLLSASDEELAASLAPASMPARS